MLKKYPKYMPVIKVPSNSGKKAKHSLKFKYKNSEMYLIFKLPYAIYLIA